MAGPSVAILDYGSGNVRSAERALVRAGADAVVTADLASAASADGLVVPGVGAFAACMSQLQSLNAAPMIAARLAESRSVLGICVGMQVLFELGDEHGTVTKGLGFLPGEVRRLEKAPRLPHMGWNTVKRPPNSKLFTGIDAEARFYFVHSYAAANTIGAVSYATYGADFVAAVEHGPLTATQFHPEKSSDAGAQLLSNWVNSLR